MESLSVSKLWPEDWNTYRDVQKQVYEQWSIYILWSLQDVLNKKEQERKKLITENHVFLIKKEEEIVWTFKLVPSLWENFKHLCTWSWFFVFEKWRNKGYWKFALEMIDAYISNHNELEKIWIMVRADNPAITLYKRCGWREVWIFENEWKLPDWKYFDEMILEKVYR